MVESSLVGGVDVLAHRRLLDGVQTRLIGVSTNPQLLQLVAGKPLPVGGEGSK